MEKVAKLTYKTLYLRYLWQSLLFIVVLLVGTFAFYNLEKQYTIYNTTTTTKDEIIQNFTKIHNISNDTVRELLDQLKDLSTIRKPMDLEETVIYTISVLYTFGWGNVLAYSDQSKIFLIFYACLSMPITTAMVITAGKIINKHLFNIIYSMLKLCNRQKNSTASTKLKYYAKLLLAPAAIILLVTFLITNAFMFSYIEDFTYIDSIYCLFTTISTIGFGDVFPYKILFPKSKVEKICMHLYGHFSVTLGMSLLSAIINAILSVPKLLKHKIEKTRSSLRIRRRRRMHTLEIETQLDSTKLL